MIYWEFINILFKIYHFSVYDKIAEHQVSNFTEEKNISENKDKDKEIKYFKKIRDDIDDVKYINKKILKSNKELERLLKDIEYQRYNDYKDINKSIEELEKNSNEIKNTVKKNDSINDSRMIIKRIRERSESPIENSKRRRSASNESK